MERQDLEGLLSDFFSRQHTGIVAVYLFGSQARGTATSSSDVDVGILYLEDRPASLEGLPLDMEADLERALGAPVQVVALNQAPSDLIHRVLRDGRLILDRDPSRRIAFEIRARNEFFDLQPVLARYRAARAGVR